MIRTPLHLLRLFAVFLLTCAAPVSAEQENDIDRVIALLKFRETIEILHLEGLRYGETVGADLLPDGHDSGWDHVVARIYDKGRMFDFVRQEFQKELADADLGAALDYLQGDDAQEIIGMELSARRTLLDPDAEAAAMRASKTLEGDNARLFGQIDEIIDDSDLIEFNVMGTLNSSLMFYRGMREGGAYDRTDDEIFADVWSTEEGARQSSDEWLRAFLAVAYEPIDPELIDDYASFYRTRAGKDLNRAIFAAFDRMYEDVSYLLGLGVAKQITSTPL